MAEGVCPIKITRGVIINIFLIFIVLTVHICQGIILDAYIIQANHTNHFTYFLMIPDFLLVFGFFGAMVQGYRYSKPKKENIHKSKEHIKVFRSKSTFIKKASSNFLGKDGIAFWIWLVYSLFLIMKIIYIFTSKIPHEFDGPMDFLGPQLLKVMLGSTAFIFVILVQRFNISSNSTGSNLVLVSILESVLDILDSSALLSLLIKKPDFPQHFRNAIVILSCIGFILPSITLLSLTRSSFGQKKKCAITEFIYRNIQLWLMNLPFLVMRMHLWIGYDADISALLVKNVVFLFLAGRISEISTKEFFLKLKEHFSFRRQVYDTSTTVSIATNTTMEGCDKLSSSELGEASFTVNGDFNTLQK
ncbi:unnamed protein product [Meganyctiphanes norvegica]|uniref:Uncharacterized protein n=1 Tax=Meganyctiphanes norvegica TaxID=48144 RepID=A0AAV2PV90_MEGNR